MRKRKQDNHSNKMGERALKNLEMRRERQQAVRDKHIASGLPWNKSEVDIPWPRTHLDECIREGGW